ncbi:MAG TPA: ATP-binding protein, partial [Anaerolineales bacterium]|nr:ATP-binding protein [Anaerolineales bacterium]
MSDEVEKPHIDASPTKEFFIDILVRDISLTDALSDLVDNCIDGALRLRPKKNYEGLSIEIELSEGHLVIVDNCGGIPADVAINYAFRFGRPLGTPETKGSIGQFGVGMKRALFKVGNHFKIETKAANSTFTLDVDVNEWKKPVMVEGKLKDLWRFDFEDLDQESTNAPESCGTTLEVTNLHESIVNEFKDQSFFTRLCNRIREANELNLENGLSITLRHADTEKESRLEHSYIRLLRSFQLKPIYSNYKIQKESEISVKLYAGVSNISSEEMGWYVFCNGRLVLRADKTKLTGWDESGDINTPKPHYQFARFRGYVFFDCDN